MLGVGGGVTSHELSCILLICRAHGDRGVRIDS